MYVYVTCIMGRPQGGWPYCIRNMWAVSTMIPILKRMYIGGLSESGLCVFRELRPVSFLAVDESPSVLL